MSQLHNRTEWKANSVISLSSMTELMKIEILLGTPPIPGEVLSVYLKTDRIKAT